MPLGRNNSFLVIWLRVGQKSPHPGNRGFIGWFLGGDERAEVLFEVAVSLDEAPRFFPPSCVDKTQFIKALT